MFELPKAAGACLLTGAVSITPQQFAQLKQRLEKPGRASKAAPETTHAVGARRTHQIILGIDPSLRGTGYGVIRIGRSTPELLAEGTIKADKRWPRSRCLVQITHTLRDVVAKHHPTTAGVEGLFFAQNLQTALIMGEARGAALVAVAEAGLEIFEIAPRKVKQAIVGYGAAQKSAVAKMVQRMLSLAAPPAPDAADALALALAFAQENGRYSLTPLKTI